MYIGKGRTITVIWKGRHVSHPSLLNHSLPMEFRVITYINLYHSPISNEPFFLVRPFFSSSLFFLDNIPLFKSLSHIIRANIFTKNYMKTFQLPPLSPLSRSHSFVRGTVFVSMDDMNKIIFFSFWCIKRLGKWFFSSYIKRVSKSNESQWPNFILYLWTLF